ncbi:recombinase family protein [Pseudokineococcus basanitobsidens]|uniref:Recombinase family protein n=1 Tax=Pseudokineococcus basanitobsidens TaxID=1926649 RepID=A0ABU8RM98_9ACTN
MAHGPSRALTYGRQSRQREDDSEGSPEAQRQQTAAYVASQGWTHVAHFEDVGVSGYDPRARRPALEQLFEAVRRGEGDAVVVYRLDRLTRRGVGEAVRLIDELEAAGASLVSATESLDTSTPMGRGIFGLFAALAEQESASISQRTRGTKAVLRRAGSWSGGTPPFGTRAVRESVDGLTLLRLHVEPAEAAVIADVAGRVIGGASVAGEAKRLNVEGTTTRGGGEWATSTLARALRSPALAGYLPQRHPAGTGKGYSISPARDDDGRLVEVGEAAVEPSTWWRLQEVLDGRGGGRGPRPTPTLLGGSELLRCGSCGSRMAGDRRADGRGTYRCSLHRRGSSKCSGTAVAMRQADEYVVDEVWRRLAHADLEDPADVALVRAVAERYSASTTDPAAEAAARLAAASVADARASLERLDDDRAAGVFDGTSGTERYRRQAATLEQRLAAAEEALAAASPPTAQDDLSALLAVLRDVVEDGLDHRQPDSPWQAWTVEERRDFLALSLDRVDVLPGGHGGGNAPWRGDERLRLVWAGDEVPF